MQVRQKNEGKVNLIAHLRYRNKATVMVTLVLVVKLVKSLISALQGTLVLTACPN